MTRSRTRPITSDVRVQRRRALPPRWLSVLLLGLAAAIVGVASLVLSHTGVLPGVTAAGIDASGMSRAELESALEPVVADATVDAVHFQHGELTLDVLPADTGFLPSVSSTADAAWAVGRDGHLGARLWDHVASLWRGVHIPVQGEIDAAALDATLDELESVVATDAFPGDISADPETLAVTVEAPAEGFAVDRGALQSDLTDALRTPGVESLEIPGTYLLPTTTIADVEAVAAQARRALTEPFEASIPAVDQVVILEPRDLAPLLTATLVSDELVLSVDEQLVSDAFGERVDLFDVAPRDATWALPRAPKTSLDTKGDVTWNPVEVEARVVPSRPGRAFDAAAIATQMASAFADGEHEASFDLPMVEPEFTTADARAYGVNQLLGTFTTHHAPNQPRVTNIQRLADVIDGTRVGPGEQFSINQLSGERTCEKGYVEDAMILNHELVDVCGGGVSQFGTTMLNAAFFAGLPIDQHKAHSHYISRYPKGREATLNYPSPDIDVRWTNDTGNGVFIRTSYTATSITVSIYGTSDVTAVSARHSAPFRYRNAPTEYVEDASLEPGEERVVESGIDGFDIEVTRTTRRAGGQVQSEDFFTRYVAIPELVHRNSSEPEPEPEPSPSPSPSPKKPKDADDDGGTASEQSDGPSPSPSPSG